MGDADIAAPVYLRGVTVPLAGHRRYRIVVFDASHCQSRTHKAKMRLITLSASNRPETVNLSTP